MLEHWNSVHRGGARSKLCVAPRFPAGEAGWCGRGGGGRQGAAGYPLRLLSAAIGRYGGRPGRVGARGRGSAGVAGFAGARGCGPPPVPGLQASLSAAAAAALLHPVLGLRLLRLRAGRGAGPPLRGPGGARGRRRVGSLRRLRARPAMPSECARAQRARELRVVPGLATSISSVPRGGGLLGPQFPFGGRKLSSPVWRRR